MKKCTNQIENICLIFWYEYERFDPFENFFQEQKTIESSRENT